MHAGTDVGTKTKTLKMNMIKRLMAGLLLASTIHSCHAPDEVAPVDKSAEPHVYGSYVSSSIQAAVSGIKREIGLLINDYLRANFTYLTAE